MTSAFEALSVSLHPGPSSRSTSSRGARVASGEIPGRVALNAIILGRLAIRGARIVLQRLESSSIIVTAVVAGVEDVGHSRSKFLESPQTYVEWGVTAREQRA